MEKPYKHDMCAKVGIALPNPSRRLGDTEEVEPTNFWAQREHDNHLLAKIKEEAKI